MRLLAIGDIHLGRRPGRIPQGLDAARLGPARAWRLAVDHALASGVDAVLLAGDVVDRERDFYEAWDDLRRGVSRLVDGGVRVLAVAGNHDVEVLPRLAAAIPELTLVGAGGRWQRVPLAVEGVTVEVLGWSFPQPRVPASPLRSLPAERPQVTTIGLLHCDRDQASSPYAPVAAAALRQAPVDAWLLGHIHAPDALSAPRPIGYLGSLSGLDPGEPGPHGPWCITVGAGGIEAVEHLPLAPLRWETLELDVGDLVQAEDVHARIAGALRGLAERCASAPFPPEALGVALRLVGRSPIARALEQALRTTDPSGRVHEHAGIHAFIHRWVLDTEPAIDLAQCARGSDPVALLARRLLALEDPESAERQALIAAAREAMRELDHRHFAHALPAATLDDEAVAAHLRRAAQRALEALVEQREGTQ